MLNSVPFGKAIRDHRGQRTQVEIANLGGPYRQLQARIERGELFDLADAVLEKYDRAFGWAPGTSATILHGTQENWATVQPNRVTRGALGHNAATGEVIDFPPHLRTTLAPERLIDAISGWHGLAVVDTQVLDLPTALSGRRETPGTDRLVSQWSTTSPGRRAVSVGRHFKSTERVAIDPIPMMTNSLEACWLIDAVNGVHATVRIRDQQQVAFTMLFLAAQLPNPAHTTRALLAVEAPLLGPEDPLFRPFSLSWDDFMPDNYPMLFTDPAFDIAANLLSGLRAARDHSRQITIDPSDRNRPLGERRGPVFEVATVLPAQSISAGTLLLHDADISPELPAVMNWAATEPLMIVTRQPTWKMPDKASTYANAYVIEVVSLAGANPKPGEALLRQVPGTEHPLLTFGDDRQPANVVLFK
ncbi:hypothetical protein [Mycobacterium kubicae]|nr:hypothetical protein [Mycobacterium kubicae]